MHACMHAPGETILLRGKSRTFSSLFLYKQCRNEQVNILKCRLCNFLLLFASTILYLQPGTQQRGVSWGSGRSRPLVPCGKVARKNKHLNESAMFREFDTDRSAAANGTFARLEKKKFGYLCLGDAAD